MEIEPKDLFDWSKVSRFFGKDRTSIRHNRHGKKYEDAINELKEFASQWMEKHKDLK